MELKKQRFELELPQVLAAALLILGYRLSRRRVEAIQAALTAHHEESSNG